MKRVISGVKPTGDITIGNYLGTMRSWPGYQDEREALYFVADLHALNIRQDPAVLSSQSLSAAAWLLALGVDPKRSTVFVESMVPQIPQLFTILNNYVTMGELSRQTQFKDKSQKGGAEGQLVGLFEYPVLMAADILLFDIDEVPVGDDQRQHVEITRDVAQRFNNLYGETLKVPEAVIKPEGSRIMDLQDPTSKMSKSERESGYILMVDEPDTIVDKVKRAVTDSGDNVKSGPDKPALTNLLQIYSDLTDRPVAQIEAEYEGKGYGQFKSDLAEVMVEHLTPLQESYHRWLRDESELREVLEEGSKRARDYAETRLAEIKSKLGLL